MGHPLSSKEGFVNGRFALFNRVDGCVVLVQELGHTYGLGHSHFCTEPPYSIPAFVNAGAGPGCTGHSECGDPFTPMMNVYEGDKVSLRVQVGAHEEGHMFSMNGVRWLQNWSSGVSGFRNSQLAGISEYFIFQVPARNGERYIQLLKDLCPRV